MSIVKTRFKQKCECLEPRKKGEPAPGCLLQKACLRKGGYSIGARKHFRSMWSTHSVNEKERACIEAHPCLEKSTTGRGRIKNKSKTKGRGDE